MSRTMLLLATAGFLAACGGGDQGSDQMAADTAGMAAAPAAESTAAASMAPAGAPTDAQIAAIVVAANSVDIAAGEMARDKASDAQVKAFGSQMVTDHTASNQQAGDLAQKLNLTPEPNPTSQQLTQGGEQSRQTLQGLSGKEFDRAYIDHEVQYHQQVLDALDNTLIPSAQNAELKSLLEKTRPVIQAHLDHAKQIQSSLGSGT